MKKIVPIKQMARNNQNHSQPSRSRDRRVEPCSRTMSGEDGGSSSSVFIESNVLLSVFNFI